MTRKEFWALPADDDRNKAKDGAYLAACSFAYDTEGRRSDENAVRTNMVALDLDEGEWVKDFDENPDTLSEHLYPYNFCAWRTAKWTKEKPRLKVIVDVDPCHPQHHRRIVAFIASRLGLPPDFKGVRESGVVSQPQYRPIQFKGSEFDAVISSRTTGVALHLSDLPEIDPEDLELCEGRTYACDPSEAGEDFFGLAFLPVADLALDDIREALFSIDPDCGYKEWIETAAALRHQFTDEDDAREAYDLFVEWSSQGTKFQGRRDCWSKWKSFRPYAKGRAPVTIRTLYKHAMDAGWDNRKVAQKISETVEEWMEACTDHGELMQEGAKRIAAMPFKNDVVEEALILAWRKRIKALTNETIDKATLRKELARVRREDRKAKQDARGENLPVWLRPFIYVASTDTFNSTGNAMAFKPAAFDRFFAMELMPKDEIPANGMPVMQPSAYALNVHRILRVEDTLYDPTQKEDELVFPDTGSGKLMLNTYNFSSPPVPDPEFADASGALFRQLVAPFFDEEWLVDLFLDYNAHLTQHPGVKVLWAFLIQSAQGLGKGTYGEIMEKVLGAVNVRIISPELMRSNFNDWARDCVLGIFNEMHAPGEMRERVMNSVKPLITDETISVNLKHQNAECRVRNITNYIAFTNYKDAAHLAENDRRWCPVFSPYQTKAQVEKLQKSGHFEKVRWLLTPEGASGLRYWLLKRAISPDFPVKGHAPATRFRDEIIQQSKNHLQAAIEDAVADAIDPLIGPQVIHEGRLREIICRGGREHTLLPRFLSQLGYERYDGARRIMIDGTRGAVWVHPERWLNGVPVEQFLRDRMKEGPTLDEPDDSMFS